MSDEQNNHLATAADFKLVQEVERPVERITLPKLGKAVLLRRPTARWFIYRGQFPAVLAAKMAGQDDQQRSVDDLHRIAKWVVDLLGEVMVQPRVSLSPGPGEISPDMICDDDLNFIIKWSLGVVASDGGDLSSFRDQ